MLVKATAKQELSALTAQDKDSGTINSNPSRLAGENPNSTKP